MSVETKCLRLICYLHRLSFPHPKNRDESLLSNNTKVVKCNLEQILDRFFLFTKISDFSGISQTIPAMYCSLFLSIISI